MTRSRRFRFLALAALVVWVAHRLRAGPNRRVLHVTVAPRAPRTNGLRAHVATLLAVASWFDFPNPLDPIIGGAESLFGGAADQIKSWVTTLVRNTFNVLWGWIGSIFDQFAGFFSAVVDTFAAIWSAISSALSSALHFAEYLFNALRDFVYSAIAQVGDFARSLAQTAIDFAAAGLNALRDGILSIISTIRDALLAAIHSAIDLAWSLATAAEQFAQSLVSQIYDWASAAIGAAIDLAHSLVNGVADFARFLFDGAISLVHSLIDNVVGWVQSLVDLVWSFLYDHVVGPLEDLASYVWDHAKPLLDLLAECIDWFAWLAKVAFDDVVSIVEAPFTLSLRDVMDHMQRTSRANSDRALGHVRDSLRR